MARVDCLYVVEPMSFTAESATVGTLPSLLEMRRGIAELRREFEFSLDALSDQSGIDRAAIHRIENVDKYPKYEPGIDTFRRLVEGLGLTLQDFFARYPPARQADSGYFHGTKSQDVPAGPRLSRTGSTVAETRKGGSAGVAATAERRHLREITALKTRITSLEIALHKARNGAREIVRAADAVGQSRTARTRRA